MIPDPASPRKGELDEFGSFFSNATGRPPYAFQRALGLEARVPSVVEVPTGSGKTHALLVSWLYRRRVHGDGPRRLVYALPMRTLVEQTADVARDIRARLELSDEDLPIHVLMGGEPRTNDDWREHPERDQVLVGTVDMLLSRALNRGYGEGRFQWPVAFGLLNADCRWVLDEVQLMGPARATSAQLDGLRATLGTALPVQTTWVSATVDRDVLRTVDRPELGEVLELPDADRCGPLARGLCATKRVERVDLAGEPSSRLPRRIAREVLDRHTPGTRSIVVLNRVDLAQRVFEEARRATSRTDEVPELVLLHSRFRPGDRAEHLAQALAAVAADGPGRIVMATQVIEAGVDTSARLLVTETAPFPSIVQRLGRCNRAGELAEAHVLWLDRGALDERAAAPYTPADLASARHALLELEGASAAPEVLEALDVPVVREAPLVLRRRDLLDLFDTGPDLSGMDVDVSRFIRDADERNVSVFFRPLPRTEAVADEPAPARSELVDVPVADLRRDETRGRHAWIFDHVDARWRQAARGDVRPGATLLLAAAAGGYLPELGWSPSSTAPVPTLPAPDVPPGEGIGDNRDTFTRDWMPLDDHLVAAERDANDLLAALGPLDLPDEAPASVVTAAALHDVGKAHSAFQGMLLDLVKDADERALRSRTTWAKSAERGGSNRRRHFRHELASALALMSNGALLPHAEDELTRYLVAAHHGRVRLSIRPAPEEGPPDDLPYAPRFALGVAEGDELGPVTTPRGTLPAVVLDLGCMELGGAGGSWTAAACVLRDRPDLGPFRLGFLEALVRVADWRASA